MGTSEMEFLRLNVDDLRAWIEVRFSRSPAPGGQNVNKVNTRVTVLFDLGACDLLTESQKARVRERLASRISREGRLRVTSYRERSQAQNRRLAEARLVELLTEALRRPKVRHKTRPTRASQRRRMEDKRRRTDALRRRRPNPDA